VNKCRDFLRSPSSRYLPLSDEEAELLVDSSTTPEEYAEQEDSALAVKHLCGRLKEPYRSVAEAYFCNGQTLSQMAKETGTNIRTLETRLYRARKMLRVLWKTSYKKSIGKREINGKNF
jgi:RNA polymerase sigma-70 factor (ECF subfamily)